jgi:polyhydroxyalkanoate synthase
MAATRASRSAAPAKSASTKRPARRAASATKRSQAIPAAKAVTGAAPFALPFVPPMPSATAMPFADVDMRQLLAGFESSFAQWQQGASTMMQNIPGSADLPRLPAGMPELSIKPEALFELQQEYSAKVTELMHAMLEARALPAPSDKRFSTPAWTGTHAYLAQLYLLNASFMQKLADRLDTDEKSKAKIRFAVSQWVDAMSPANYLATNPEAQQKLIETRGQSLAAGLLNMFGDFEKGRISQTDESAFEVGVNVANTPGDVVYQNRIFQLIQYKPSTPAVYQRPLLMVPPCINKFYILDLQPENSLVAHCVAAGHTVFMMSWKNPDEHDAGLTWDDYIEDGVIKAIRVVQEISEEKKLNLLGFCVGGTMLSTALAVLAAKKDDPCKSLTLLTTLLDFSDTGALDVFVDEAVVRQRERSIGGIGGPVGLMPARDLATSFSFLRPNDLVWNYVVSNYLKGESPAPFDLLYWNADSTNLPGPFFVWYLRHTYLQNELKEPGAVKVCGVPVDLGRIDAPAYLYGSREDHIVPWVTAYEGTRLLSGPLRFVLGASGHIAGVINPPAKKKRNYWTATAVPGEQLDAKRWLENATEVAGSWWPDWTAWLSTFAGKQVKPKKHAGHGKYKSIEAAPGSYVRQRAV